MMKVHFSMYVGLVFFVGCSTSIYQFRDYKVGVEIKATVGSSMMRWGLKRDDGTTLELHELRYGGIDHKVLFIKYREFVATESGLLARPAFDQDLRYDVNETVVITYQDVRIEIREANSTFVRYVVLEDPESMRSGPGTYTYGAYNPCNDSLYLVLKKKMWNSMTLDERKYVFNKEQECENYTKEKR